VLKHKVEEETTTQRTEAGYHSPSGRWVRPRTVRETHREGATSLATFVMIRKGGGVHLIRRQNIRSVLLDKAMPVTTTFAEKKKVREISVHVAGPGRAAARPAEVGMVYLQKGVRWIPDYQIELLPKHEAKLTLQGTLINELADLEDVTVRMVVGVPSFMMKEQMSPMALREIGLRLGTYFAPPGSPRSPVDTGYQMFANHPVMSQSEAPIIVGAAPGVNVPGEGQREDLFLYHKPVLSLKKGERAVVQLLTVKVPYQDIYTWDVPPIPPKEMWRHLGSGQQQTLAKLTGARAMHELRLTNTGKDPWTTGPATLFKGGTPLGQQLMTFTSVGNKVDVPVTVATDLNTKKVETETARKHNIRIGRYDFTRVDLRGKLTVTNFKNRDVQMIVRRQLIGTAGEATLGGKVELANVAEEGWTAGATPWYWGSLPTWWHGANPLSKITWELKIPKGKAVTLEYSYHYFYRP